MKQLLTSFLCTLVFASQAQQPVDSRQQEIVFQQVHVIPMDQEQVLENQTVVVKDGKIVSIGKAEDASYGEDALLLDAGGKYLIPGLAEMHAHVPPVDELAPIQEVLTLFAVNGITTIRGMLGHPLHLEVRSRLQQGEMIGPRLTTTGPSFNGQSVTSPSQAAEMVRQQQQAGYDYLKIHPGLTAEEFFAVAEAAHEADIPFVGHVPFGVGIWKGIEAGYSSIDHLDAFIEGLVPGIDSMTSEQTGLFGMFVADEADTSRIPDLMQALQEKEVWVVPTQALAERWFAPASAEQFRKAPEMAYMSPQILEDWVSSKENLQSNPQYDKEEIQDYIQLRRKLIRACQESGVGLLLGSDAPQVFNVPGFSTHQELEYMVASGLTPFEALQSGTVNVARYLQQSEEAGIIKAGGRADMILLNGNPLEDIRQTQNIAGVMLGHLWLSGDFVKAELKKLEEQQKQSARN